VARTGHRQGHFSSCYHSDGVMSAEAKVPGRGEKEEDECDSSTSDTY